MKRTALIAWDYPPSASGLAVAAREIAESLGAAGVDVTVFTLDRTGTPSADGTANGVRIVGCRPEAAGLGAWMRGRMALGHLVAPAWFARAIAACHRKAPFDCLEATNWYAPAALAGRIGSLPLVVRHSTPAASTGALSGGLRDRLDGRFACRLEARTARAASGHIFNTDSHGALVARLYGLHGGVPTRTIGLSLPPERLARGGTAPYPPERIARDACSAPAAQHGDAEPVELLFVGRAEARKGFDCLLDAVTLLAEDARSGRLPDFRLRLVGIEAEQIAHLSDAARRHVEPLGRLFDADLDAAYRAADLVVAPSRYESFGLVYQEALAFGRPVVALAVDPSARRAVGECGAGLLAAEASGASLAEALRLAIGDRALRLDLHRNARRAAGRFTRETLAQQTIELYALAAERHGRNGVRSTSRSNSRPFPGDSAS